MHRLYIAGALALLLVGTHTAAYFKGYAAADKAAELWALQSERDFLKKLLDVSSKAQDADKARLMETEAQLKSLQQEAEDHAEQLSDKDRVCFEPSDADRVRDLFRTAR